MTKMVRFIQDWDRYRVGTVLNIQTSMAEMLIKKGVVEEFKSLDEPPCDKMMRHSSVVRK